MNSRYKRLTTGIALLVIFSFAQIYIATGFAGSVTGSRRADASRGSAAGILVTSGKNAILVNGINAVSDATIISGASVETPQAVSATINLGLLGHLDIAPATSLKLDFGDDRIKVTLFRGCVVLFTRGTTIGTIETPSGVVGGNKDSAKGGGLDVCLAGDKAATPLVNQGAAAHAGAGAGSGGGAATTATVAAGGASGGLSPGLGVLIAASLIIPMTAAAIILNCDRGLNPSPELNTKCR